MLFSLVYAASNVYNWIYCKHMTMSYIQLINNCLQHHCSVIVRHLPRTSTTVTALVRHKQHKDVKQTVLVTNKQFELSSVEPQISLSIADWARLWIDQKNIRPTVQDVFVSLDLEVTNSIGQSSSAQEVPIGELCDIIASQQNVADQCVNVIGKCSTEKFLRLVHCFLSNSRLLLRHNNMVSVVSSVTTVLLTDSCGNSDNQKVTDGESKQPNGENCESPAACIDKLKLNTDSGTSTSTIAVPAKPPNIVIYCGKKDSSRLFESVKSVICQCINTSRYTVYHLKHEQVATVPWNDNVVLLIVASDKVYDGVDRRFLEYFQQGGRLISFGSAFDSLLVRRKDRVVDVKSLGVLTLSFDGFDDTSVICSQHCYDNASVAMATSDDVKVVVLGTDRSTRQAVVVSASHTASNGQAILSQVNFDKDPVEMAISTEVFALLKRCNPMRFQILTDLLSRLCVDCSKPEVPALTPVYLLSKTKTLQTLFLDSLKSRLCDGCLTSRDLVLKFTDDAKNSPISAKRLPVVTSSHCSRDIDGFNTSVYCEHLSTAVLGNTIMFADVISTTMTLFDGLMFSCPSDVGLIAIARRQLSGQGRGGNVWLSPVGCAMFSLHVRVPLYSELGQRVTYVQHLMALAVVLAVRHKPGCQSVEVCIKWPNDIYFGRDVKLGGIIVKSTIMDGVIHANIGCGVNVTNKDPTMCINDILSRIPVDARPSAFSVEEFIARTVTTFEQLVNEFQSGGPRTFLEKYYLHWLHSGATVTLNSEGGPLATVVGLDDYGYLLVRLAEDGSTVSVQPDGNSYDMMKNLIAPKTN